MMSAMMRRQKRHWPLSYQTFDRAVSDSEFVSLAVEAVLLSIFIDRLFSWGWVASGTLKVLVFVEVG